MTSFGPELGAAGIGSGPLAVRCLSFDLQIAGCRIRTTIPNQLTAFGIPITEPVGFTHRGKEKFSFQMQRVTGMHQSGRITYAAAQARRPAGVWARRSKAMLGGPQTSWIVGLFRLASAAPGVAQSCGEGVLDVMATSIIGIAGPLHRYPFRLRRPRLGIGMIEDGYDVLTGCDRSLHDALLILRGICRGRTSAFQQTSNSPLGKTNVSTSSPDRKRLTTVSSRIARSFSIRADGGVPTIAMLAQAWDRPWSFRTDVAGAVKGAWPAKWLNEATIATSYGARRERVGRRRAGSPSFRP